MKVFAKYLILLFLTISLFSDNYHSQATYHYVGTNNLQNTNSSFPSIYGNFFRGVKHQILVRATELQSAGISAGNITGLAFDIVSNSGNVLTGFEIEMKSTTQQSLSTWDNNNLATYFGPSSFTDQIGWNQHDFSSPFYWDGSSNIVIQTCFYNNSWSQNAVMNMSNYGYNSLIYRRRDNSSPCNSNWINGVETQRPNIRFSWVDPSSPPISNFSTSGTSTCSGLVNFYDQTSNSPNNWLWNFGDGNYSVQSNPTHIFNQAEDFDVSLTVITSLAQCEADFEAYVTVRPNYSFFVPNAFSPNNDGLNDVFRTYTSGVKEFELFLFDSYGKMVFNSSDDRDSWDGTYDGKPAPQGIYVYQVVMVKDMDIVVFSENGAFTLIR